MKYCCEKLETLYRVPKSYGINIRFIKLSDNFIKKSKRRDYPVKKDELYSFIMTEGYQDKLDNNVKKLFIEYCPFCGKKMSKIYSDSLYINENNHIW